MTVLDQLEKTSGTVLVLSGGATKAFYFHVGVLKALQEENITAIVGSSAGAVVGALIASGATVDNIIGALYQKRIYLPRFNAWVKTLTSTTLFKPRYLSLGMQGAHTGVAGLRFLASLPWLYNKDPLAEALDMLISSQSQSNGFFDSVALEKLFRNLLPTVDFRDTDVDLYVTGTCLDCRLRAIFNSRYDIIDMQDHFMTDVPIYRAVRASAAVPGMFEPVKIKGRYYVDGEVKRTLSADVGVQLGDRVIVSHTYQPLYLSNGDTVSDMGWLNVLRQSATIVFHERIAVWREIYEKQNPGKKIVWIQPDADDIEFFNAPEFTFREEVQKTLIRIGERAARKALALDGGQA